MKARSAIIHGGAGIDSIEIRSEAVPTPRAGEALVRLRAATLNYRDLIIAKGMLPGLTSAPTHVPLSCAAGEVVAVGEGVVRVKPGDRVNPTFFQGFVTGAETTAGALGGSVDGVARDYAAFPAGSLCLIPDELGDLEAATLPCAGLTAWSALFGSRPARAGETVLVQGTGGVSLAALQWAKAAGVRVVITSSSDVKLHRAKAMGADVTINYRVRPDWAAAARDALGGGGVDIVIDTAGAGQLSASASLLNDGGIIAAIGMLDGGFSRGQGIGGKTLVPISVGDRNQHEAMLGFAARHGVRPVVDAVYDLTRLADALRHLESGSFFGKIGVSLL
jgi:NADPH:quinone reductase-like Zn-dependent oxidoreductase